MTTRQISKILRKKQSLILLGFEKIIEKKTRDRARKIATYLTYRAGRVPGPCQFCNEKQGRKEFGADHYDSPFDETPKDHYYCSRECLDLSEGSDGYDFAYRRCDVCSRSIMERCASNGWHEYFRYIDDGYIMTCLQCYQENILENGISAEDFEAGTIKGMFFDGADLRAAGFTPVEGFQDYFICGSESIKKYTTEALRLIASGCKVVNSYESMGLGGGEGYISLWRTKQ